MRDDWPILSFLWGNSLCAASGKGGLLFCCKKRGMEKARHGKMRVRIFVYSWKLHEIRGKNLQSFFQCAYLVNSWKFVKWSSKKLILQFSHLQQWKNKMTWRLIGLYKYRKCSHYFVLSLIILMIPLYLFSYSHKVHSKKTKLNLKEIDTVELLNERLFYQKKELISIGIERNSLF